jgi:hypothetical protein
MPVIVDPKHYRWWLMNDCPGSELVVTQLNHPCHDPLKIYPVSNLVNSPANDDPRCIEPAVIDRDLFEKPWWGGGGLIRFQKQSPPFLRLRK